MAHTTSFTHRTTCRHWSGIHRRSPVLTAVVAGLLCLTGSLLTAPAASAGSPGGLSAGTLHACAVLSDSTVRCWGRNSVGNLGNGTFATSLVPVAVTDTNDQVLTGVVAVTAGSPMTCARMSNGTAQCWGSLNGVPTPHPSLLRNADSTPLTGVAEIAIGGTHFCVRTTAGNVRCAGSNFAGQLGDGSTTVRTTPVFARNADGSPLGGVTQISTGFSSTCARLSDGTARCWGNNFFGQAANGNTTNPLRPTPVRNADGSTLTGIAQVATGGNHACVRMTSGNVRCMGNNANRQLGDGTTAAYRTSPVFVRNSDNTPLGGVTALDTGANHSCVRASDGTARCWGSNTKGQLGDGTTTTQPRPVFVRTETGAPLSGVVRVVGGEQFSCARLTTAQLRCWGLNDDGQLGDGSTILRLRPVVVLGGPLADVA